MIEAPPLTFGTQFFGPGMAGRNCDLNPQRAAAALTALSQRGSSQEVLVSSMAQDLDTYVREFQEKWIINPWQMRTVKGVSVRNKLTNQLETVDTIVTLDGKSTLQDVTNSSELSGLVWQKTHQVAQGIANLREGQSFIWISPSQETDQNRGANNRIYKAVMNQNGIADMFAYSVGGEETSMWNFMENLTGQKYDRQTQSLFDISATFQKDSVSATHEGIFTIFTKSITPHPKYEDTLMKFSQEIKIPDEDRLKDVKRRQKEFESKIYKELLKDESVITAFANIASTLIQNYVDRTQKPLENITITSLPSTDFNINDEASPPLTKIPDRKKSADEYEEERGVRMQSSNGEETSEGIFTSEEPFGHHPREETSPEVVKKIKPDEIKKHQLKKIKNSTDESTPTVPENKTALPKLAAQTVVNYIPPTVTQPQLPVLSDSTTTTFTADLWSEPHDPIEMIITVEDEIISIILLSINPNADTLLVPLETTEPVIDEDATIPTLLELIYIATKESSQTEPQTVQLKNNLLTQELSTSQSPEDIFQSGATVLDIIFALSQNAKDFKLKLSAIIEDFDLPIFPDTNLTSDLPNTETKNPQLLSQSENIIVIGEELLAHLRKQNEVSAVKQDIDNNIDNNNDVLKLKIILELYANSSSEKEKIIFSALFYEQSQKILKEHKDFPQDLIQKIKPPPHHIPLYEKVLLTLHEKNHPQIFIPRTPQSPTQPIFPPHLSYLHDTVIKIAKFIDHNNSLEDPPHKLTFTKEVIRNYILTLLITEAQQQELPLNYEKILRQTAKDRICTQVYIIFFLKLLNYTDHEQNLILLSLSIDYKNISTLLEEKILQLLQLSKYRFLFERRPNNISSNKTVTTFFPFPLLKFKKQGIIYQCQPT